MKPCGCLGHRSSQTARSPCNSVNSAGSVRLGWWGRYHMDLCGKVAVITGGKRIGRVVAQELAQHGMNLVLSYRGSKEEAEQTAADVEAAGRRATIVSADVSKPADCLGIFEQALEVARDNILVNAIAPGPIVPPPDMDQQEIDEVAKATPVGHWGGEAEIAKAVALLCQTDFITGETIRVDGGRHLE